MTWNQTAPTTTWDGNRATWMSQLPDDLPIQNLSIPGTHDSAALVGFTHFNVSVTQNRKIEDLLAAGVRFLDLRVKIMYGGRGLAMYHGVDAIYDPDQPTTSDQFYYKAVIGKCVEFLKAHPKECIVVSVKCEGDTSWGGWTVEDWFRQIANEVAADNAPGTWDNWWDYRSNVNATLNDVRGKMLLWRRFPREGKDPSLDYSKPFGLDLTPLNGRYDNTRAGDWYVPNGGYVWVQDHYKRDNSSDTHPILKKFNAWYTTLDMAWKSRCIPGHEHANRQFINFSSVGDGKNPSDYSDVMNVAMLSWLKAMLSGKVEVNGTLEHTGATPHRSGFGVLPMDYPTDELVDTIIKANFGYTYAIGDTQMGGNARAALDQWVSQHDV